MKPLFTTKILLAIVFMQKIGYSGKGTAQSDQYQG